MRQLILSLMAASAGLIAQPCMAQMPDPIDGVEVQTQAGTLLGSREGGVLVFRGVPYAAPPVGDNRWRPPQPVDPWKGVRAATAHEAPCTQPVDTDTMVANFGGVNGAQSEDCLYLTITVPEDAQGAPVLVWFHGGAFFLGAGSLGSYDGTANAKHGVITVSVNYRLGALANFVHPALDAENPREPKGNYALQDSVAVLEWVRDNIAARFADSGNVGQLDLILALQWVRDNIAAFGGDPEQVTIAGQSAGGGIVTNLLSIPSAKGLFDKAIVQSGSLLLPDRPRAQAQGMAIEASGRTRRQTTCAASPRRPSLRPSRCAPASSSRRTTASSRLPRLRHCGQAKRSTCRCWSAPIRAKAAFAARALSQVLPETRAPRRSSIASITRPPSAKVSGPRGRSTRRN